MTTNDRSAKGGAYETLERTMDDATVQVDALTALADTARWGRNAAAICAGTLAILAIAALVLATLAALGLVTTYASNDVLGVVAAGGAVIGYLTLGIGMPEIMRRNDHLGEIRRHEASIRAGIATAQRWRGAEAPATAHGEPGPSRERAEGIPA